MKLTKEQYKSALSSDGVLKDDNIELLSFLFYSPQCEATAPQITSALGLGDKAGPANAKLGNLGKRIAKYLSIDMPERENNSPGWWKIIAYGEQKPEGFTWLLRPELAEALIELGLLDEEEKIFPEIVPADIQLKEGTSKSVRVNIYERNPVARKLCINHYGAQCVVCGFDFEEEYGVVGAGFIHVHHLIELAEIGEEYKVNPVTDLRPVCPNCHAMIHRQKPAYTIDELRVLISAAHNNAPKPTQ